MLSEVVLQHLDRGSEKRSKDVRYLRYVDDIRLMAKDEKTLRRRLVVLDLASKEVGLFPQGAKIEVRQISNPEDEIKSVSNPPEPAASPAATQDTIRDRVKSLAKRGKPTDTTRLRFILPRLKPTRHTNGLLVKVLDNRPDLYRSVASHLGQYRKLPKKLGSDLVDRIHPEGVYHVVNGAILELLFGRLNPSAGATVANIAYERLFGPRFRGVGYPPPQPTYRAALFRWALQSARLTYSQLETAIQGERDWWVRKELVTYLDARKFGRPSFEALLNLGMQAKDSESARVAASVTFANKLGVVVPHANIHWSARLLLRNAGLIRSAGRPPSLIPLVLPYVLGFDKTYDWRRFFGADHPSAERIALISKQRFETDIDAFVVSQDSFCDLILLLLYRHNGYGSRPAYGNALQAGAPAWLKTDFPKLRNGFSKLHLLRIRSLTAHPKHLKTGAVNRRITHAQYYRIRRSVVAAFDELAAKMPM